MKTGEGYVAGGKILHHPPLYLVALLLARDFSLIQEQMFIYPHLQLYYPKSLFIISNSRSPSLILGDMITERIRT